MKLIFSTILACLLYCSATCLAADWQWISSDNTNSKYLDMSSLKITYRNPVATEIDSAETWLKCTYAGSADYALYHLRLNFAAQTIDELEGLYCRPDGSVTVICSPCPGTPPVISTMNIYSDAYYYLLGYLTGTDEFTRFNSRDAFHYCAYYNDSNGNLHALATDTATIREQAGYTYFNLYSISFAPDNSTRNMKVTRVRMNISNNTYDHLYSWYSDANTSLRQIPAEPGTNTVAAGSVMAAVEKYIKEFSDTNNVWLHRYDAGIFDKRHKAQATQLPSVPSPQTPPLQPQK